MIDSLEASPKRYFVTKKVMPPLASETYHICMKPCGDAAALPTISEHEHLATNAPSFE